MRTDTFSVPAPARADWAAIPGWLHAATAFYCVTNVFNGVAMALLAPHPVPLALVMFGMIGGFTEHVAPYFPRLALPRKVERWCFQVPTMIGIGWTVLTMSLAWHCLALFALFTFIFTREPSLNTSDRRVHLSHGILIHGGGVVAALILLAVRFEWSAWMTAVFTR